MTTRLNTVRNLPVRNKALWGAAALLPDFSPAAIILRRLLMEAITANIMVSATPASDTSKKMYSKLDILIFLSLHLLIVLVIVF
jgi:hypothetical protein